MRTDLKSDPAEMMMLAQSVTKSFGNLPVLQGIDLAVPRGKVFCLIGSSGSGKSTFLRCINHLETIDGGRLLVDGRYVGYEEHGGKLFELGAKALAAQRAQIGMVFQRFNLFPHLTVVDNITAAPLVHRRCNKAEAQDLAHGLLERVGLRDKAKAYPSELSGGQQQRVAIARTLAMQPKLLLFDEPTSALDPELVGEVLSVMRDLAKEGRTMIVVTHEISFAVEVADTLVFMHEGKVLETGPPAQLLRAATHQRTTSFLAKFR
jgi:polar amino acid transport system ATP-binding protein